MAPRTTARPVIKVVTLAFLVILVVGGGVAGYLHWRKSQKSQEISQGPAPHPAPTPGPTQRRQSQELPDKKPRVPAPSPSRVGTPSPSTAESGPASTPPEIPVSNNQIKPTRGADQPKAISDFKTGTLKLEKATGSSLVYAIGSLTNDSSHQRYGVRVEVALTDANGKSAGVASDYRQLLEPGEIWRFRALILDSKARVATLKEILEEP